MFATARCRQRPSVAGAPRPRSTHACNSAAPSVTQATRTEQCVARARMLYEDVWSHGKIRLLNDIMTEDHVQRDVVWQPENTGGGRDRLKRGVLAFRKSYPDLKFTMNDVAACEGSNKVFVQWDACGTNLGAIHTQAPTGQRVTFSGITLLSFDSEGLIQESQVYRQAPQDEASYFISQGNPMGMQMASPSSSNVGGDGNSSNDS